MIGGGTLPATAILGGRGYRRYAGVLEMVLGRILQNQNLRVKEHYLRKKKRKAMRKVNGLVGWLHRVSTPLEFQTPFTKLFVSFDSLLYPVFDSTPILLFNYAEKSTTKPRRIKKKSSSPSITQFTTQRRTRSKSKNNDNKNDVITIDSSSEEEDDASNMSVDASEVRYLSPT